MVNKRFSIQFKRHSTAGTAAELVARMPDSLAYRVRISFACVAAMLFFLQTANAQNVTKNDSVIVVPTDSVIVVQSDTVIAAKTSTVEVARHSPRKATIYSLILPGLGQAYNKKYWKIPVIYAGLGTLVYFIVTNNKEYVLWRDAYRWKLHKAADSTFAPVTNPYLIPKYESYNAADYLVMTNYYRRNLEVSVMFTAVLYILNVVDAAVDAHFFDFNISDDLTMHWQPYMNPTPMASRQSGGFRLTLSF